jgi:outer membrane protein OmpA-like peptidoglycan-associated protein
VRHATFFLLALAAFFPGCSFTNSRLTTCQAEKEQLLTAMRTQRDTNRTLQTQVASLESRLDQAEKELARSSTGTRLSSLPSPTVPTRTPDPLPASTPMSKTDGLPWRSPRADASRTESSTAQDNSASSSLLALARRDRRVQYSAEGRTARVNLPVSFEEKSATLTADDKRQLDDLARLLKTHDTRDVRVMVAGFGTGRLADNAASGGDDRFTAARQLGVARAQAVADYLDRHGIAQERLAVTAASARTSNNTSGVQIYLFDADAPAVAWWPGEAPIRR